MWRYSTHHTCHSKRKQRHEFNRASAHERLSRRRFPFIAHFDITSWLIAVIILLRAQTHKNIETFSIFVFHNSLRKLSWYLISLKKSALWISQTIFKRIQKRKTFYVSVYVFICMLIDIFASFNKKFQQINRNQSCSLVIVGDWCCNLK